MAVAAEEAYATVATVAHVHVRDANGLPTADVDIASEAVERIHNTCLILVRLSTGVGPGVPLEERAKLVELRPRMASLNPYSMSFGNFEFSNNPSGVKRLAKWRAGHKSFERFFNVIAHGLMQPNGTNEGHNAPDKRKRKKLSAKAPV